MKQTLSLIILGLSLSLLVGCTSIYTVEVVTNPPGAVIEVDGEYMGKSPLTIELQGWSSTKTLARDYTINALPIQSGQYTQTKRLNGWYEPSRHYGNQVPKKIYFDLNLVPAPSKHELNVDINR